MTYRSKKLTKTTSPKVQEFKQRRIAINKQITLFTALEDAAKLIRKHDNNHKGCCMYLIEDVFLNCGIIEGTK